MKKTREEFVAQNVQADDRLQAAVAELQVIKAEQVKAASELQELRSQLSHAQTDVAEARAELKRVTKALAHANAIQAEASSAASLAANSAAARGLNVAPTLRKVVDGIEQLSPLRAADRKRISSAVEGEMVLPTEPRVRAALPILVAAYSHVARENGVRQVSLTELGPHLNAKSLGFSKLSLLVASCPELFHYDREHGIVTARF